MIGLADAGILFPAVSEGILFPPDPAGMPFPADLAEPVTVGVIGLADAGILFPAVSEGILFPPEPAGMPFPADHTKPITVDVIGLADAGILFPAVSEGILFPPDHAGMPFPADHAEPVTVGVAGLADAGILFPAVSEGIPFLTDPVELLFPADHVELCTVGVTDLDELSELGTFAGTMEDEVQSSLCCYEADGVDFWDPVIMAKELGCRVDELQVYYGHDLWNPDGSDFGYSDYYDDQSELSYYEDPGIFSAMSGWIHVSFTHRMDHISQFRRSGWPHYRFLDTRPVCQTYRGLVKNFQLRTLRIPDVRERATATMANLAGLMHYPSLNPHLPPGSGPLPPDFRATEFQVSPP